MATYLVFVSTFATLWFIYLEMSRPEPTLPTIPTPANDGRLNYNTHCLSVIEGISSILSQLDVDTMTEAQKHTHAYILLRLNALNVSKSDDEGFTLHLDLYELAFAHFDDVKGSAK